MFANVNAEPITDAVRARALLLQQLTAPVRWTAVVQQLAVAYPQALYVELGTGNVLTGLIRRIAPQLRTATCGTVAEVDQLLEMAGANV